MDGPRRAPGVIAVTVRASVVTAVVGDPDPDLATVDVLAWLRLGADRIGYRLVVTPVTPELRSLLRLTGLEARLLGDPAAAGPVPSGPGAEGQVMDRDGARDRTSGTSGRSPGTR